MRLIDSDALLELYADTEQINFAVYNVPVPIVRQNILDMPTIEAEPVRHGRWIHTDLAAHWHGKDECSECTYHEKDRSDLSHLNYCPNCGCKMQGAE